MNKSITDFVEDFINRIVLLQENFFKNPKEIEELVYGMSDELQKLGLTMIKAMLEEMNQALCKSSFRKDKWYIEKHDHPWELSILIRPYLATKKPEAK